MGWVERELPVTREESGLGSSLWRGGGGSAKRPPLPFLPAILDASLRQRFTIRCGGREIGIFNCFKLAPDIYHPPKKVSLRCQRSQEGNPTKYV